MMPPEIVGEQMKPEQLYDAVNILLSLQVRIKFLRTKKYIYSNTLNYS